MDFRTAMLTVADAKDGKVAARLRRRNPKDHPRLWAAMEHAVARKYERRTRQVIPEGFDWSTILDWLKANWRTILTVILTMLTLF